MSFLVIILFGSGLLVLFFTDLWRFGYFILSPFLVLFVPSVFLIGFLVAFLAVNVHKHVVIDVVDDGEVRIFDE